MKINIYKNKASAEDEQRALKRLRCPRIPLVKLYDPDFVTGHFGQLLKKHNLKKIRFHDLRHSCASVLLAGGVPMKQIREWLGHSDMSTTVIIKNPYEQTKRVKAV